jgi:hypothetical protein
MLPCRGPQNSGVEVTIQIPDDLARRLSAACDLPSRVVKALTSAS